MGIQEAIEKLGLQDKKKYTEEEIMKIAQLSGKDPMLVFMFVQGEM